MVLICRSFAEGYNLVLPYLTTVCMSVAASLPKNLGLLPVRKFYVPLLGKGREFTESIPIGLKLKKVGLIGAAIAAARIATITRTG